MKKLLCIVSIVLYCCGNSAAAIKNLGVDGAVYEIVERDLIEEMKATAARIDWSKVFKKEEFEEKIKNWQPESLSKLPRATKDNVFLVDMTYTTTFDIPDGKGGILYPKGFVFNPASLVKYPMTIVVIDGSDQDQLKWFAKSGLNTATTKLLLSGGSWYQVAQQIKRPVFFIDSLFMERFRIKTVPSVINQDGLYMKVREIYIP